MAPFIRDGDVITLRPCRDCPPRTGDVVAFVHPVSEQLLIHRVLAMNGCSFMTQGDNAPVNDGMIPEERVLGRVVAVERNGTRVRFGLGVERFLIVVLVRSKLLHLLLSRLHECA
ncbi:MAG TPA: S26 family signal peptidase [Acidobacteriota bacterium]|nr:S26 family signal peptidase [Acidobacteriota bacterium]